GWVLVRSEEEAVAEPHYNALLPRQAGQHVRHRLGAPPHLLIGRACAAALLASGAIAFWQRLRFECLPLARSDFFNASQVVGDVVSQLLLVVVNIAPVSVSVEPDAELCVRHPPPQLSCHGPSEIVMRVAPHLVSSIGPIARRVETAPDGVGRCRWASGRARRSRKS